MRLNVKAFGLTCALIWGFGLLLITFWLMLWEGPTGTVGFIGRVYRGYTVSPLGGLIGFAWAFVDGLIVGVIFAWLYNLLAGSPKAE